MQMLESQRLRPSTRISHNAIGKNPKYSFYIEVMTITIKESRHRNIDFYKNTIYLQFRKLMAYEYLFDVVGT